MNPTWRQLKAWKTAYKVSERAEADTAEMLQSERQRANALSAQVEALKLQNQSLSAQVEALHRHNIRVSEQVTKLLALLEKYMPTAEAEK